MPELLLELRSEEIPARMQARAAEDLKRLVTEGLSEAGLSYDDARAFATPRRLALVIDGIPARQPDTTEERRGPRADAPKNAIEGFRKSLPKGAKVETRETEKGTFHFAVVKSKGRPVDEILHEIVYRTLWNFPWPKSMRWGKTDLRWIRPIQNLLIIFGSRVPHSPIPMLGPSKPGGATLSGHDSLEASNQTVGHPFLAPERFKVRNFKDYEAKLRKNKVILDPAERRTVIEREAKKRAKAAGLRLRDDPGLLAEVAGLCEWPVVRLGRIDAAYMELPDEVLTTVMRHHQKYFALLDKDERLAPRFAVVLDTETRDRGRAAVAGNERVLRARLADAQFFWDQDRKQTLESGLGALQGRVFHAKLGSVMEKVLRMEQLAGELAEACAANPGDAMWAARLAKADLATEMVVEFPELQGVMGRYYALNDGESRDVADAVAEHYAPQGPTDACPSKPVSVAVALADKIDTLIGFFSIGEKPTGSKDPFALRRAALGVIRLIIENGLRVPLLDVFARSRATYEDAGVRAGEPEAVGPEVLAFIADRLKVHLRGKGVRHDLIDAVFAQENASGAREDDLVRLLARVDALAEFLESDDGGNLLIAYKRAANIVRIEEKNDAKRYDGAFDEKLLAEEEERTLARRLGEAAAGAADALGTEDFTAAMAAIARLRRPVDDFFDHVTVNCEDAALRENRLRLLSGIGTALDRVADFSKLEGGER